MHDENGGLHGAQYRAAGMDNYVSKPLQAQDLFDLVERLAASASTPIP